VLTELVVLCMVMNQQGYCTVLGYAAHTPGEKCLGLSNKLCNAFSPQFRMTDISHMYEHIQPENLQLY